VLHTIAIGQDDKGFQQFDRSRIKVCHLDLHTKSQWSKDDLLQNAYMAILFVSLAIYKNFIHYINSKPNDPQENNLAPPKKTHTNFTICKERGMLARRFFDKRHPTRKVLPVQDSMKARASSQGCHADD
jgi:hypothetical protein